MTSTEPTPDRRSYRRFATLTALPVCALMLSGWLGIAAVGNAQPAYDIVLSGGRVSRIPCSAKHCARCACERLACPRSSRESEDIW